MANGSREAEQSLSISGNGEKDPKLRMMLKSATRVLDEEYFLDAFLDYHVGLGAEHKSSSMERKVDPEVTQSSSRLPHSSGEPTEG